MPVLLVRVRESGFCWTIWIRFFYGCGGCAVYFVFSTGYVSALPNLVLVRVLYRKYEKYSTVLYCSLYCPDYTVPVKIRIL